MVGNSVSAARKHFMILGESIALKLDRRNRYAAVVDVGGFTGKSVHYQENQNSYSDGNASWFDNNKWDHLQSSFNTKFRAEFVPIPEPRARLLLTIGLSIVFWRRRPAFENRDLRLVSRREYCLQQS